MGQGGGGLEFVGLGLAIYDRTRYSLETTFYHLQVDNLRGDQMRKEAANQLGREIALAYQEAIKSRNIDPCSTCAILKGIVIWDVRDVPEQVWGLITDKNDIDWVAVVHSHVLENRAHPYFLEGMGQLRFAICEVREYDTPIGRIYVSHHA